MLSPMQETPGKSPSEPVGTPEFMRLKHFREKPTGVHETLYRYL